MDEKLSNLESEEVSQDIDTSSNTNDGSTISMEMDSDSGAVCIDDSVKANDEQTDTSTSNGEESNCSGPELNIASSSGSEEINDNNDHFEPEYEQSEIVFSTLESYNSDEIFGVTFLGRNHKNDGSKCQDNHKCISLGDNWYCLVVSDGAGSAAQSHRGAKINCELSCHLVSKLISKLGWTHLTDLPSDVEWHMHFYELCRSLKKFTSDKVESLDEKVAEKDFNATLILVIVTPLGLLVGHIGDGRAGYLDFDNNWHSIITPHRGDEPNQTIFLMNAWDKVRFPHLSMSGVFVPETRVIRQKPKAVTLLTDGCENFCWNCVQYNHSENQYSDINTPFEPFWDNLLNKIQGQSSLDDKFSTFLKYIDSETLPCREEGDDRSLFFGTFNKG